MERYRRILVQSPQPVHEHQLCSSVDVGHGNKMTPDSLRKRSGSRQRRLEAQRAFSLPNASSISGTNASCIVTMTSEPCIFRPRLTVRNQLFTSSMHIATRTWRKIKPAVYSDRIYERQHLGGRFGVTLTKRKRVFGGSQYTWSVSSRPSNPIANTLALHIIITVMAHGNKETPYR